METIFNFIHKLVAYTVTYMTLFLLDLPLKIFLCLVFITLSIVGFIFYPVTKYFNMPEWIEALYQYATQANKTIAHKIWKAWS